MDKNTSKRKIKQIRKEAEYYLNLASKILRKRKYRLSDEERERLEKLVSGFDSAVEAEDVDLAKTALRDLESFLQKDLRRFYKSPTRDMVEWLVVAFIIALLLRFFVVEAFKIPSGSMYPTLWVGDHIFVNKFIYGLDMPIIGGKIVSWGGPERGDVIVFRYPLDPSEDYIKRVIGLPGDDIKVRGRKVWVNGKLIDCTKSDKPYYYTDRFKSKHRTDLYKCKLGENKFDVIYEYTPEDSTFVQESTYKVPQGFYFVMGDNRDHSADSRVWGFVPADNIEGKALVIWLSVSKVHGFVPNRIGRIIH